MPGGPNVTNPCKYHYAGCTTVLDEGGRCCASCRREHNAREAARRAERKAAKACTVCGKPVVRVDGVALTTCKAHREYFRARAAG